MLGLGFRQDFEGIFEIQKQFLPAQTEVRTNLFKKIPTLFGIFSQSDNFGLFYGIYESGGTQSPTIDTVKKIAKALGINVEDLINEKTMLNKNEILNKEKTIIENFFNKKFVDIPDLPSWITEELIQFWDENFFYVHYVPKFSLDESSELPLWRDKLSKIFYKKIREGKLKNEAKILSDKWLLIDGRDKPKKKVPWIRINDVWLLEKMGFNPKNYLKKWHKQLHQNEYLMRILQEKGFGSRFCLTIHEINDLKSYILNFLKIEQSKIVRLPFLAEYNYFGNAIYKQWRTTETWEWFEDKFDDGQHLAGGSYNVGCMGWEPPEFWSTILTFRPVIEL